MEGDRGIEEGVGGEVGIGGLIIHMSVRRVIHNHVDRSAKGSSHKRVVVLIEFRVLPHAAPRI